MGNSEVSQTSHSKRKKKLLIYLCVALMVIVVLVLAVTLGITLGTTSSSSLKATFMDRCKTFLKENDASSSQNDCEKIWNAFKQAFVGRDPCDVPPEAYDTLIQTVSQDPACNRMLFWSKTKDIVHDFTEKRNCYLTMENTLLGSILDELTWCGRNNSQETLTSGCPGWSDCENNPVRSFWNKASAALAASACGEVYAMLNGSIDMPFNPTSIFASVEVKNFNSSIMTGLTVFLVTKETDMKTCENDASLKDLQNQLDPNLKYACKTVPQSKIQTCIAQPQIACGDCW